MELLVLVTFVLTLIVGVLSGMGGGGAGFIVTPYYIFIGLTPAEAVATGKMGGFGISSGSIIAFRGKGLVRKKYLWAFLAITTVCALVSAWLIPKIDAAIFQQIIGWSLLLLTPTLFIKKAAFQPGERSGKWIVLGFILYTIISFGQTTMGGGIGTLLVLVFMFLFGLNALEANATKRVTQFAQAFILFILLFLQGLVVVWHGAAALVGSFIGGHIGSNIAIKKGAPFVKIVLAFLMFGSGLALLLF